jgi:hypothetical protein
MSWRFKMEPFCIEFVMDDDTKYLKWQKEVERKGYNITRKMKWEIEMIRKELEDKYIKEGADIDMDGTWVKAKSIYSKGKENKEVSGQIVSFKIDYDWSKMMPYRRDIYWEEMKKIVNKYKEIRMNAAKAKKERKEREKKIKAEAPIIKKPNIPINKEKPKPITI